MDTDEHTPVTRPGQPRTKAQERADFWVRILKVVVGPLTAALLAIGVAYVQRSSDKSDVDKKAQKIEAKGDQTTTDVVKELAELKRQMATVAGAAQVQAKLAVETHEDAPKKRRRARGQPEDTKLIDKIEDSVADLEKVKAKASKPVAVTTVPASKASEKPPEASSGGGGATTSPNRGERE